MKGFIKILSAILLFSVCFSFISCNNEVKNREYDKEEVETAAKSLIEKSLILNEILYGKGIGYIDDESSLIYKTADEKSLESFGVYSVEDIKNEISKVFSSKYIASIEKSDIFTPLVEDDVTIGYARYFEDEKDGKITFYVNSSYNFALKNPYEYIGNIEAIRSEGEYVIVKAIVKATRKDGKIREFEHEIKLIEESAGWRLATSTYVVYNEYTDIYEDMNK